MGINNRLAIICMALLLFFTPCHSQVTGFYTIDRYNGLPSNHAYFTRIDSHGYLWIATEKGVVKYNGYSYKIFGRSSGMHSSDVWYLYEDRKGRMWLSSISDEAGYIYRDAYHKVFIKDTDLRIYPAHFRENINGDIMMVSQYDKNDILWKLYREKNDTFYLAKSFGIPVLSEPEKEYFISNGAIYTESNTGSQITYKLICENQVIKKQSYFIGIDSFIAGYNKGENFLTVFNINNCSCKQLQLSPDDHIFFAYFDKQFIVHTDAHEYIFNSLFQEIKRYSFKSLLSPAIHAENNVLQVNEDSIWQQIITTAGNGIFVSYKLYQKFRKLNYDIKEYRCVSNFNDYIFWWNKRAQLLDIQKDGKNQTYKCQEFSDVYTVASFDSGRFAIASNNGFFLFKTASVYANNKLHLQPLKIPGSIPYYKYLTKASENTFYAIHAILGIETMTVKNNSVSHKNIYSSRFAGAFFDTSHKNLWCYAPMKIVIYNKNRGARVYDRMLLQKMGINNIESILMDSNENIFIQDADKLTVYDEHLAKGMELFKEYNLTNAQVSIFENKVIAAGKFGIAFSRIYGTGSFSKPVLYCNVKNMLYEYISDLANSKKGIILNTDKGVYTVPYPADSEFEKNGGDYHYRWNICKNSSEKIFKAGDTILMKPKSDFIVLDVINPYGNGALKFDYLIEGEDGGWTSLNTNEVHLSRLAPAQYYKISFRAKDDAWRSAPVTLTVCIIPYWWQTGKGKFFISAAALLLGFSLFFVAVQLAKRRAIKKTTQKNLQLELELRAIHTQINPHFIFNTLNSALSFIRRQKYDDAYTHISKFSSLLRAYIKSSRNRLVLISDEIINLSNYIELQQTRFVNKFDYSIEAGEGIDTRQMLIPSLLLQPIVENAINHGLIPLQHKGNLYISFQLTEHRTLLIVIDDNGIGREAARIMNKQNDRKESWGNILVNDLVTIFNNYEKIKISISYIDKQPPLQGTTVEIRIKYPDHDK